MLILTLPVCRSELDWLLMMFVETQVKAARRSKTAIYISNSVTIMCVIPVVRINYLKESNSQNTTCLEIDGIFYN
jgi:hypothetical protein